MPLQPDQRTAIQKAMQNTGLKVEYLILGPDGRTTTLTDMVGYLEWCLENGDDGHITVRIASEEIGTIHVSTIFLSSIIINGNDWAAKRPFETMVFDSGRDMGMTRKYASIEEAEIGHREVVAEVLAFSHSDRPGP